MNLRETLQGYCISVRKVVNNEEKMLPVVFCCIDISAE